MSFLSFDLADEYNCLQTDPAYQKHFGFNIRGRLFQMTALPSGWNQSPYAFTTAILTVGRRCFFCSIWGQPSRSVVIAVRSVNCDKTERTVISAA